MDLFNGTNQSNTVVVIVLATVIYLIVAYWQDSQTHCCRKEDGTQLNSDGNGKYLYKGRGHDDESMETLLQRIDWSAKHFSDNDYLFILAYKISFLVSISLIIALFPRWPTMWEVLLFLLISYIIIYSVLSLAQFHVARYPLYYIRDNVKRIQQRKHYRQQAPPDPILNDLPHRTQITDLLQG